MGTQLLDQRQSASAPELGSDQLLVGVTSCLEAATISLRLSLDNLALLQSRQKAVLLEQLRHPELAVSADEKRRALISEEELKTMAVRDKGESERTSSRKRARYSFSYARPLFREGSHSRGGRTHRQGFQSRGGRRGSSSRGGRGRK